MHPDHPYGLSERLEGLEHNRAGGEVMSNSMLLIVKKNVNNRYYTYLTKI